MERNHSFYVYLQKRLLECCGEENTIDISTTMWKIINVKIPKVLVYKILNDMERLGLCKKVNRFKIKIENVDVNKEIDSIIEHHC